jgi:hypothetical protein
MTLQYVGASAAVAKDVAYKALVDSDLANNLTTSQVDQAINSAYSPYVLKSYVDSKDALNANKAYIDAGDATRVKLTQRDVANGLPSLDASGKLSPLRINVASTQRFPRGLWTPSSYPATKTALTAAEAQLCTMAITDPGYAYKLLLFGEFDCDTFNNGYPPVINIRLGSTTGPIVATGIGSPSYYDCYSADEFNRTTSANLGGPNYWTENSVTGSGGNWSCDGNKAIWNISGTAINITTNQRTGADALTSGDYQRISAGMVTVPDPGNDVYNAFNLLIGRMSGDGKTWVAWAWSSKVTQLWAMNPTLTSPAVYNQVTWAAVGNQSPPAPGDLIVAELGNPNLGSNYYTIYKNGIQINQVQDSSGTFTFGASYRGWGFGGKAGQYTSFGFPYQQTAPGSLDRVCIDDYAPSTAVPQNLFPDAPVVIHPSKVAAQSVLTGAQTLYVMLANPQGSASQTTYKVEATTFRPNLVAATVAV